MIYPRNNRICLDASILVSIFLKDRYYEDSSGAWSKILRQDYNVVCPNIVLVEVAGAIYRNISREGKIQEKARKYIKSLQNTKIIKFVDIDKQVIDRVIAKASEEKLRGMDSLYVSVASIHNCSLVTLDKEQLKIGAINTLRPSEFG